MSRVWAMPNKWTFKVSPLRNIIDRYKQVGELWADPFAGFNSPAELTNDLNPDSPAVSHVEAVEFLRAMPDASLDGVLFDPPYSLIQIQRNNYGKQLLNNPTGGFPKVRDEIARIMKPGGHVIVYGWTSAGMGIGRGFTLLEILLCAHGGNHHDTIVTVERRT